MNPPYDPSPYLVTEIRGHQLTAQRDHAVKTRDAQKWKKISTKPPVNYDKKRQRQAELNYHPEDVLLDFAATPAAAANHEPIREFNNPQAAWAKLFHARTTLPLTLQIDHHEYVEDLTSSKLESRNYPVAHTSIN